MLRVTISFLMSSLPISISRCGYSNSRDVVASSPSFSHPTVRRPRRACWQVMFWTIEKQQKHTLSSSMYRQRYIDKEPHPLEALWSLNAASKHWAEAKTFLYAELDLTISFPSAISLAHGSSFKKDQDILVLPLDLQKFDTHEKLAQDVLKHFGKVKRNKYIEGWIQQQLVWVDNVSLAVGITVITDQSHDLVNWAVSSLANRPCCLIITVSVNYTTPGVNLIKLLQVSYFLHVVESENNSYTCNLHL